MKLEIKITSDAEKILKKFNNTATVEKDVSKLVKDTLYNIERDAKKKCMLVVIEPLSLPVSTGHFFLASLSILCWVGWIWY